MGGITEHPDRFAPDPLIAEIEALGSLIKGSSCQCPNPAHEDRNPSASIYQGTDGAWRVKCFACDRSWDVFDLREMRTGERGDAVEPAPKAKAKIQKREPRYADSVREIEKLYATHMRTHIYRKPGCDRDCLVVIIYRKGEGKSAAQWHQCDDGRYVDNKGDEKPPLYRLAEVVGRAAVVVTEGEKDVDSLITVGIPATTASGGAGNGRHTDWSGLEHAERIYLWPDNDEPGARHMVEVAKILEEKYPRAKIITIDPSKLSITLQHKGDASDYLGEIDGLGLDKIRIQVKGELNAAWARAERGASSLSSMLDLMRGGQIKTAHIPLRRMDQLLGGLRSCGVSLLVGGPGSSKSLLAVQMMAGWIGSWVNPCMLALEMVKYDHMCRVLAQDLGDSKFASAQWVEDNHEEFERIMGLRSELLDQFERAIDVADVDTEATVEYILSWMEKRAKAGHKIIIIDPITATDDDDKPFVVARRLMKGAIRVAMKHYTHIIFVTHTDGKNTDRKLENTLSSVAGGQALTRFASQVIIMQAHDSKTSHVMSDAGYEYVPHNRTLVFPKTRFGSGRKQIAAHFAGESLLLKELGVIVNEL